MSDKGYFVVYCATNTKNGKKYIGYTQSFERRKSDHLTNARSTKSKTKYAFHYALQKYGEAVFEWSILGEYTSSKLAIRAEKSFIRQIGTLAPAGYNLVIDRVGKPGGKKIFSDETILAIKQDIIDGQMTYRIIGEKYGIAFQTVSKIATNRLRGSLLGRTSVINRSGFDKYHPDGIKKPNKETLQQLLDCKNITEISKIYGVARNTIYLWATKMDCSFKRRKESTPRPSKNKLQQLLDKYGITGTAKILQVCRVTISKWSRAYECINPPRGEAAITPPSKKKLQDILSGMSVKSAAKLYNIGNTTIAKWIKKLGCTKTNWQKGSNAPRVKLTESQVLQIRKSKKSRIELAEKYGVSVSNIDYILLRRTWTHI